MVKPAKYDFSGWATKYNMLCADGVTISNGAFDITDGAKVPLVWNHERDVPDVLGHAILEKRPEGIYTYGVLNDTENGILAKKQIKNGDLTSLSIFANKLKKTGTFLTHGVIREVSLVLAGANPGAFIDTVLVHGEKPDSEFEAYIFNDEEKLDIEESFIEHSDNKEEDKTKMPNDEKETTDNKQKEKTVEEAIKELPEDMQKIFYYMINESYNFGYDQAQQEKQKNNTEKEEESMKHNAFEKQTDDNTAVLTHSAMLTIINEAKKGRVKLKDAVLDYIKNNDELKHSAESYGIENVDVLFPEAKSVNGGEPYTISSNLEYVAKVLDGASKSPFTKVKSTSIDITQEEARAKGYVKGNEKTNGVLIAARRVTSPQTVYKKEKMDRDDIEDIVDFDSVAFVKKVMKIKLNEELANAILVGDGRDVLDQDKIKTDNIRPILGDHSLYTIAQYIEKKPTDTETEYIKRFMKAVVKSRKEYRGSGNPTLFTTEDMISDMLLLEDTTGRTIYDFEKLKNYLRVKDIVSVEAISRAVRSDETHKFTALAIMYNPADYQIGSKKGAELSLFNQFDIDFNQEKYLLETRLSGALVIPKSAITFELKTPITNG